MRTSHRRWKAFIALALATSLVASACGDDDEDSGSSAAASTTAATATGASGSGASGSGGTAKKATVAGCEANGYTDPADLSMTRKVARCTAGSPAPKPLATKTKVVLATNFKLEFNSPVALAEYRGEYAKENLEVEVVNLSFANAVPQLNSGQVDIAIGGFETSLFNAGNQNLDLRVIAGNYFPPKAGDYKVAQTGLWCRRDSFSTPNDPKLKELETKKWASSVGKGSSAIYYSAAEIKRREPTFEIKKTDIQQIPAGDILTAIKNKTIDCGILLDPIWVQVKDDPNFFLAASQTPGEPLGMMVFGKNLLKDKQEVGDAFLRAYIRTVNTYYAGNYHQDASVMADIQKFTGQSAEAINTLKSLDPLTFDWEVRLDTTTRVQQLFIDLGVITNFSTPVPDAKLVDRSFYERVVGVK